MQERDSCFQWFAPFLSFWFRIGQNRVKGVRKKGNIVLQRDSSPSPHSAAGISSWTSFHTIPTECPLAATSLARHKLRLSLCPREILLKPPEVWFWLLLASEAHPETWWLSGSLIPGQSSYPPPTLNSLQYHSHWTSYARKKQERSAWERRVFCKASFSIPIAEGWASGC